MESYNELVEKIMSAASDLEDQFAERDAEIAHLETVISLHEQEIESLKTELKTR